MLILNSEDIRKSLSMATAIEGMRQTFAALGRGDVVMPNRMHIEVAKHQGEMLVMPSFVAGERDALAVKMVGVFPENVKKQMPSVQGLVCVFDPESCKPIAILEGAALTGIRTAAVSAVATDILSRLDSRVLSIIGTGVRTRTHIEAICAVRQIKRIQLFGRSRVKIESVIADVRDLPNVPDEIAIFESGNGAVSNSDIVCTVTSANEPVFSNDAIADGTHINAVGSHSPSAREIPAATVVRARVVVDQRQVALHAGDLFQPIEAGLITEAHVIADLGELASDRIQPNHNDGSEITLFKSVGLAMQDAVASRICVDNATAQGIGQEIDW